MKRHRFFYCLLMLSLIFTMQTTAFAQESEDEGFWCGVFGLFCGSDDEEESTSGGQYKAPGVYIEEIDAGTKPIEGVDVSVVGAVGVTVRGPSEGVPALVTSFDEFVRKFGQIPLECRDVDIFCPGDTQWNADDVLIGELDGQWFTFPTATKEFFTIQIDLEEEEDEDPIFLDDDEFLCDNFGQSCVKKDDTPAEPSIPATCPDAIAFTDLSECDASCTGECARLENKAGETCWRCTNKPKASKCIGPNYETREMCQQQCPDFASGKFQCTSDESGCSRCIEKKGDEHCPRGMYGTVERCSALCESAKKGRASCVARANGCAECLDKDDNRPWLCEEGQWTNYRLCNESCAPETCIFVKRSDEHNCYACGGTDGDPQCPAGQYASLERCGKLCKDAREGKASCVSRANGCAECLHQDDDRPWLCEEGQRTNYRLCNQSCPNGYCTFVGKAVNDPEFNCYECDQCPKGTYNSHANCEESCDGTCSDENSVYKVHGKDACYSCIPKPKEEGKGFFCGVLGLFCGEEEEDEEDEDLAEEIDEEDPVIGEINEEESSSAPSEPTEDEENEEEEGEEVDEEAEADEDDEDDIACPDLSYGQTQEDFQACKQACSNGTCKKTDGRCWFCVPEELEEKQTECSDVNKKYSSTKNDCQRSCTGRCTELYLGEVGGTCFECHPASCPAGTDVEGSLFECEQKCDGECTKLAEINDETVCYKCNPPADTPPPPPPPPETCASGTLLAECELSCEEAGKGTCETNGAKANGKKCYDCRENEEVEEVRDDPPPPSCSSDGLFDSCSDCPGGTECTPLGDCFACAAKEVIVNCPDGTFKDECPASCSNGCAIAGQDHGVTCYTCKQSCEEVCSENGFQKVGSDWSDHIQNYIEGFTCVSSAQSLISTTTIGDCRCSNPPETTVDETVPICQTSCGDVACGQSASCPGSEPNSVITAYCNWGGWRKVDVNQFQPIVGN